MSPAFVLMLLLATLSAALAHVLWGKRWLQLPVFLIAALAGCFLAAAIPLRLPLALLRPAGVPVLESMLLVWVLLIIVSRLRV